MISKVIYYTTHPFELTYLFQMKKEFRQFKPSSDRLTVLSHSIDDREFCYEALKKVSRSFAIVIQQLPEELRDPVCLFYLILRGLDTVEDDMGIAQDEKKQLLLSFAERMNKEAFILENVGDTEDYRDLMLHFDRIIRQFHELGSAYKEV